MFDAAAIGERLRTQDNRITADPIFLVQEQVRTYGIDPACDPEFAWLFDDEVVEVDAKQAKKLETQYQETLEEAPGYRRVGYFANWVYVQPFFTEAAADRYIFQMKHRHRGPLRTYVDSAYRNWEWQSIREMLLGSALLPTSEVSAVLTSLERAMLDQKWDSFKTPELWKAQISITDLLKSLTPKGPNP